MDASRLARSASTAICMANGSVLTSTRVKALMLPMNTDIKNSSGLDERELATFRAAASDWWKPDGKFKPLHALGPVRMEFIRDHAARHFGRDARSLKPFSGLSIADVGCGGGLLCEPMARLGGQVTGIDPLPESIDVAQRHAEDQGLTIRYLAGEAADLARQGDSFDLVVSMEVVEHVPDASAFIRDCAAILKPGGLLLLSTINRTAKSYAFAIVGAEYVLQWLPKGTHRWEKFITPAELEAACTEAGLTWLEASGCVFNALSGGWRISDNVAVNYFAAASKS